MVDVLRIKPVSWLADDIIEGWTNLSWTERFQGSGEFQLTTPEVSETLAIIPEGSYLAISDSSEIMRVENHSIDVNDDGVRMLTVTGRSFVSYLENRIFRADPGLPYEMKMDYTADEAIAAMLVDKLNNPTSTDLTGGPNPHESFEYVGQTLITQELIVPQMAVSTSTPPDLSDLQTTAPWYLDNSKDAYQVLQEWLSIGNIGLRISRPPNIAREAYVVDPTTGAVTQPSGTPHGNYMHLILYNGRNRTTTPNPYDPLDPSIFHYTAGHLSSPKYLISKKNYKNVCRAVSSEGELTVGIQDDGTFTTNPTLMGAFSQRFEMQLDLGAVDPAITDVNAWLLQQATAALKANNRQTMIDAEVSPLAPSQYDVNAGFSTDYYLGDKVTVVGEYGISEDMLVTEYVRSYDAATGAKGYPTFAHINPSSA